MITIRIIVKSKPEFWNKEKSSVKPNTVRVLDGTDVIEIQNTESGETFERIITDLSVFNDTIIISFSDVDVPKPRKYRKRKHIKKKSVETELKKLRGRRKSKDSIRQRILDYLKKTQSPISPSNMAKELDIKYTSVVVTLNQLHRSKLVRRVVKQKGRLKKSLYAAPGVHIRDEDIVFPETVAEKRDDEVSVFSERLVNILGSSEMTYFKLMEEYYGKETDKVTVVEEKDFASKFAKAFHYGMFGKKKTTGGHVYFVEGADQ